MKSLICYSIFLIYVISCPMMGYMFDGFYLRDAPAQCGTAGDKFCVSCTEVGECAFDGTDWTFDIIQTCDSVCEDAGIANAVCSNNVLPQCMCSAGDSCIMDPYGVDYAMVDCRSGTDYIVCEEATQLADIDTCECVPDPNTAPCPSDPRCPNYYIPSDGCGEAGYYYCDGDGKFVPETCKNGCYNVDKCNCDATLGETCTEDCPYRPDPKDPTIYIDCITNTTNYCSGGEIYSQADCDCIDPSSTTAPTTTPNPMNQCTPDLNTCPFMKDTTDCSIYYVCNNGAFIQERNCLSEDSWFNEYICGCWDCPCCGSKPDPDNDHNYINCQGGVDETPITCGAQFFNPDTCTCEDDAYTTEHSSTEPSSTEVSSTEPSSTEPSSTEPSSTEPSSTEPSSTEPSSTEPSSTEPSSTEPSSTETSTVPVQMLCDGTCDFVENNVTPDDCRDYWYCNGTHASNYGATCQLGCWDQADCKCLTSLYRIEY